MSWTTATYNTYAYPYSNTWGSRSLTSSYYSSPSPPAQTSLPSPVPPDNGTLVAIPPPAQPEPKKKRKKFVEDGRRMCLIVSIALLASLIFIAIVILIILTVLPKTATILGQTSDDVAVGFSVTRTDLTFTNDLADAGSQAFKQMEQLFCDMILKEWFRSLVSYNCQCVQFTDYRSDSLSARMQLSANEKTMILTNLLSDLQTALPLMSERDTRVLPISRSDIQIVQ